jgi:hypothetical protein
VIAISIEVIILMAVLYSILLGVGLTFFDVGLQPKYKRFFKVVLATAGGLISVFFVAHLIMFYPNIVP